ncbi:SagB/ThcOx family dehydrogenase [Candidatus Riflebacteria bacterium]
MSGTGEEFIEKTKYRNLEISAQQRGEHNPALQKIFVDNAKELPLPSPQNIKHSLREIIETRSSVREYKNEPISQEMLSYLLWCTQGVKEVYSQQCTLRTVPSAGARHAFETFLLVNNVTEISPGLYQYLALDNKLAEFATGDAIAQKIVNACLGQDFVGKSAVTFFWVAVVERMRWRYSDRGFRYLFLEAGHVCQNLYLAAESLDCGVCAIAAFDDDKLNEIFNLDGKKEFVVYLAPVGRKK